MDLKVIWEMSARLISAATAVMVFTLLIAGNAWAQDFDPCAGLTGKAKGLCTEYSKGMGCSSDVPHATPEACANVATMLEEVTGPPPPPLRTVLVTFRWREFVTR